MSETIYLARFVRDVMGATGRLVGVDVTENGPIARVLLPSGGTLRVELPQPNDHAGMRDYMANVAERIRRAIGATEGS